MRPGMGTAMIFKWVTPPMLSILCLPGCHPLKQVKQTQFLATCTALCVDTAHYITGDSKSISNFSFLHSYPILFFLFCCLYFLFSLFLSLHHINTSFDFHILLFVFYYLILLILAQYIGPKLLSREGKMSWP